MRRREKGGRDLYTSAAAAGGPPQHAASSGRGEKACRRQNLLLVWVSRASPCHALHAPTASKRGIFPSPPTPASLGKCCQLLLPMPSGGTAECDGLCIWVSRRGARRRSQKQARCRPQIHALALVLCMLGGELGQACRTVLAAAASEASRGGGAVRPRARSARRTGSGRRREEARKGTGEGSKEARKEASRSADRKARMAGRRARQGAGAGGAARQGHPGPECQGEHNSGHDKTS